MSSLIAFNSCMTFALSYLTTYVVFVFASFGLALSTYLTIPEKYSRLFLS